MGVCEGSTALQRFGLRFFCAKKEVTQMMMNAGAGNRTESPSAPVAGVLTLLDGPGRREKAEMERGLALLGRDLFDGGAVW